MFSLKVKKYSVSTDFTLMMLQQNRENIFFNCKDKKAWISNYVYSLDHVSYSKEYFLLLGT